MDPPIGSSAAPTNLDELWRLVEKRMGVCPSFFKLARQEPSIAWGLFRLAEFAYLDGPMPSLLKELLFTYLSRFCEVRYCVARHCAFLLGRGFVAGDPVCRPVSVEQALALLQEPLPEERELPALLGALAETPAPLGEWPEFHSELGRHFRIACALIFIEPAKSTEWVAGLKRLLGPERHEQLMLFLAFVRTAHFWTHVHPELTIEPDVEEMLREHDALGRLLMHEADASRWQLRAALEDSEQRYRQLVEGVPVAMYTCDATGLILLYNEAALELWGRAPVLGKESWCGSWRLFKLDGEPLPIDECPMAMALKNGRAVIGEEVVVLRPDGSRRHVLHYPMPIFDARGSLTGAINMVVDVTERRRTEEALRAADRRKSEFLAMLAPELRGPLSPIRNAVQILQRAPDEQTLRRTSEMLERQVGLMAHLINDLLDVSRISLGKIELRMQRTQISSVVQFAIETVRPLYESKRQQLTVTMPPEPIFVMGDGARLAQIIGNLLNNACKFTKREGRIRLSVQRDAGQVLILVEDNGIGIAADQLTRIFEMFTQVDTSLERSNGGLGIGLTLVKTLVDLHGGSAEAQSAGSGKGSLLIVRLPVLLEAPPQAGSESPRTAHEPAQRRILVVDDNRDSAESLAMLLSMSGHEVETAEDGVKALAAAANFRPDVILLDIGLPVLNGYEVAQRIREQRQDAPPLLVALTGWGQAEDRRRSKEAGFDVHLVKPVDRATLERVIESFSAKN